VSAKKRSRTLRRAADRELEKLTARRLAAFRTSPSGSPETAELLTSATMVESRAAGSPCPRCGGKARVAEHRAVERGGAGLRVVDLECSGCGLRHARWYRIEARVLN
jgi:hypothetical protein